MQGAQEPAILPSLFGLCKGRNRMKRFDRCLVGGERWSDIKLFLASFPLSSNNNYLQLNFWKVKYLCFKITESCCVLRQGFKNPDVMVWIWSAPPKGHIIEHLLEVLLFDVRALRRKGLGEGGSSTLGMLLQELMGPWLLALAFCLHEPMSWGNLYLHHAHPHPDGPPHHRLKNIRTNVNHKNCDPKEVFLLYKLFVPDIWS